MDAKSRVVDFVGSPCGDGDFHFLVDAKTFERVTGDAPTADDKAGRDKYRLYPQMLAAAFRCNRKVQVKLTVKPV